MSFGIHTSRSGAATTIEAITADVERLTAMGFRPPAIQIFAGSPRSRNITLTDKDIAATAALIARTGTRLVIHGSYLDIPWSANGTLNIGACHSVADQLILADRLGATGVVVHLGKSALRTRSGATVTLLSEALSQISARVAAKTESDEVFEPVLWLEINAMKPIPHLTASAATPATFAELDQLAQVFDVVHSTEDLVMRVGLCIDTAHMHACGVSVSSRAEAEEWLSGLGPALASPDAESADDEMVPVMLHLNDAAHEFGSGRDKHMPLTGGEIWRNYGESGTLALADSGLAAIIEWVVENNITTILERDDTDADLRLIHRLIGEQLHERARDLMIE